MAEGDKKEKSFDGLSVNELKDYSAAAEVLRRASGFTSITLARPDVETKTAESEIPALNFLSHIIIQSYDGRRSKETLHEEVVAYFTGGHVYKGSFADGLMHGYGEYTWADGLKYEGDFKLNVPMGHGKYTWLDGGTYEGEVCEGIRHGTGTYKSDKPYTMYEGQWHKGKRHGKGIMYFNQEATSWYEGEWQNNRREGWGKRCYPSGDTYEGQWKNNVRHGEGTMKWIQLGQQYSGHWLNGVQHGHGTHTWFQRRTTGSQYQLRNKYTGTFAQGLRHGQGTFVYASGAVYTGSWKDNKKHGQGKFISKNVRVYNGEFIDDRMVDSPASFTIPLCTPTGLPCSAEESSLNFSILGSDITLDIDNLLNRIPEAQRRQELRQVEFAIMRYISLLRSIYSVYSRLWRENSPDNTYLLSQLQFWQFLKDCSIHQHGLTLALLDRLINKDISPGELNSPLSSMLLRKWITCIVIAAYHIYHSDFESSSDLIAECFSKFMKQNIIPERKNIKGRLYRHPLHAVIVKHYTERCWEIYQTAPKHISTIPADIMTARHLVWMFKVFNLFDDTITIRRLLDILSLENPMIYSSTHSNLDLEINFLEFFRVLLSCAAINTHGVKAAQIDLDEPVELSSSNQMENSSILSLSSSQQSALTELSESTITLSPATSVNSVEEFKSRTTAQSSITEEEKTQDAEKQMEAWLNRIHQFFSHTFFPAYEHCLLWKKEMQEEQARQIIDTRISLEKARANAKLQQQQREEERKSKKISEDKKEEERNSAPALITPVQTNTVNLEQSNKKKKKK